MEHDAYLLKETFLSCIAGGKLFNFSVTQFLILENGDADTVNLIGLLRELS